MTALHPIILVSNIVIAFSKKTQHGERYGLSTTVYAK